VAFDKVAAASVRNDIRSGCDAKRN